MQGNTTTTKQSDRAFIIEIAEREDRAAIAMTMPEAQYLKHRSWAIVARAKGDPTRVIIGALLLSESYIDDEAAALGLHMEVLKEWVPRGVAQALVSQAVIAARSWGARKLHLINHLAPESDRAALYLQLGFSELDTFDTFELDLAESVASWSRVNALLHRRLRGTQEVELHELNEQATPRIAQFWSTMIGGQTEELNDTLVRALAGLDAQVDPRFSRYATCRGAVVGIALCAVKDNALKTIAIAVAKPLRLQGIQTQLLAEVGQAALAQGATLQVFEAGRRQPDTQRLASRKKATCRASRVAFQLDLARTNQN